MPSEPDITSPQNARVKALVKLRDQRGRRKAGLFIAEGWRAVQRAAAAGLKLRSVYLCESGLPLSTTREQVRGDISVQLRDREQLNAIEFVTVSPSVFRKIAYVREPEGVLAVCEPPAWSVDALPPADASALDLVAVGTEKPGNLGAMVRTADLAGCRSVIAAGTPVDAMNPNAIRASTGAVFTLPTIAMPEEQAIQTLMSQKMRVIAAVVDGEVEHTQADYAGPCAIAIGPEDRGLGEHWREAATRSGGACVRIATAGRSADSLNASVAAGVLLFEAARQRRTAGLQ
ncbi:MAG: TrmH family RNA methyltransferase [Phycisphaeraceae bacterium]